MRKFLYTLALLVAILTGGFLPPGIAFLWGFVAGSIWYWLVVKPSVVRWLDKKYGDY